MIRLAFLGLFAIVAGASHAKAETKLQVVATFSILGDLVTNVGGDRVVVETLVGPDGDSHAYTPKPTDAKKLAAAQLVFVNGLGLEGWIDRLIDSSGAKSAIVQCSRGVAVVNGNDAGPAAPNPHAWQSVPNARIYIANIRDALIAADPASADTYKTNAAAYLDQLDRLDKDIRATLAEIPDTKRGIVTPHPSFVYFGEAYGLRFQSPAHLNHEAEASAKTVAAIIASIRRDRISAIFVENTGDRRLMQQIAKDAGVRIGGPLYSDALTQKDGAAPTYLAMMRQNLRAIADVLRSGT